MQNGECFARPQVWRRGGAAPRCAAEALESRRLLSGTPLLPDLFPLESAAKGYIDGWSLDTTSMPGHTLLRLTTALANQGQGPLELRGGAAHPGGTQDIYQRVYNSDGTFADHLVGAFAQESDGDIHFGDYADFNLRSVTAGNGVGNIVRQGHKDSFCLIDVDHYNPALPHSPSIGQYDSCGQVQGVDVGWTDVYNQELDEQWIDVTGVPAGQYWLEVHVDVQNRVLESNYNNNFSRILINLNAQPVSILPDRFEPNDGFSAATNLGVLGRRTESGLSIDSANDVDYFRFTAAGNGNASAGITFQNAQGDLDLFLYDANQNLISSSQGTGDSESVSTPVAAGATYYLQVIGYGGATNPSYTLTVNSPGNPPPADHAGNTLRAARNVGALSGRQTFSDYVGKFDHDDFYRLALSAPARLDVLLSGLTGDADLQLVRDANGNGVVDAGDVLATSAHAGTASEQISSALAAGTYFVHVYQHAGEANYALSLTADAAGDTLAAARSLGTLGGHVSLSDFVGDDGVETDAADFYRFFFAAPGRLDAQINSLGANADLRLLDAAGRLLAKSTYAATDPDSISRQLASGAYYLQVVRVSGSTNYNLDVTADYAGSTIQTARDLGTLTSPRGIVDFLGNDRFWMDCDDFYRIRLSSSMRLTATLGTSGGAAVLDLLDSQGHILVNSPGYGQSQSISRTLAAGVYYVHVHSMADGLNYRLGLSAT